MRKRINRCGNPKDDKLIDTGVADIQSYGIMDNSVDPVLHSSDQLVESESFQTNVQKQQENTTKVFQNATEPSQKEEFIKREDKKLFHSQKRSKRSKTETKQEDYRANKKIKAI